MISESVDAMFIDATAFLVQSEDGRVVVLSFRGTQPANFINWLTDMDVDPAAVLLPLPSGPGPYGVHAGFYRNTRAVRFEILAALKRALAGRSVSVKGRTAEGEAGRMEALYITGHSLGAAMASLMAIMLMTDSRFKEIAARLKAVYTFGQPMLGDERLASACDDDPFLRDNVIRYVYRNDVVPHLPPRASGHFAHFGKEYRYSLGFGWSDSGPRVKQMGSALGIVEAPLAFFTRQVRLFRQIPFAYSLDAHGPQHYVDALTPAGKPNEYGDDPIETARQYRRGSTR
jgi:hypothetical protein